MSDPTSDRAHIPLDVVLHVVDSLSRNDVSTLCACALSSHALLSCVRRRLYHSIKLEGGHRISHKARLLSRTLRSNTSLGLLVNSLAIKSWAISPYTTLEGELETFEPVITSRLLPFHLLTELRALVLNKTVLASAEDLVVVIGFLPRLERLVCDTVWDGPNLPARAPRRARSRVPASPKLKELAVVFGDWDHPTLAERLLLNEGRSIRNLRSLRVLCAEDRAALVLPWVSVIQAAAAALRAIEISMVDRRYPRLGVPQWALALAKQYDTFHAYVLAHVARCVSLRYLHLQYHAPPSGYAPPPVGFFGLVCGLVGRQPAPFPTLTRLRLRMVDREGSMVSVTDDLCAYFAASLLDRRRYPKFRRLTLRVQLQVWKPRRGRWSSLGPDSTFDRMKDAAVEKWRAAFSAFDEDPHVMLDVAVFRPPPPWLKL